MYLGKNQTYFIYLLIPIRVFVKYLYKNQKKKKIIFLINFIGITNILNLKVCINKFLNVIKKLKSCRLKLKMFKYDNINNIKFIFRLKKKVSSI